MKGDMEGFILAHYDSVVEIIKSFIAPLKLDHYSYITRITQDDVRPDVMCIFLLCKMYGKHAAIVTDTRVWYTFKGNGTMQDCDLVLVFKGGNVFANTKPKEVRWKKPEKEQDLIFEAGEKVPTEEQRDPDYNPREQHYKPKLLSKRKDRRPSRQAARRASRKVRSSYYHDPDYVVEISGETESSMSEAEVIEDVAQPRVLKKKKLVSRKETREKVIGTIKILESVSSMEEYDVGKYPGILTFQEATEQGLIRAHQPVTTSGDTASQKKTVPARIYSIKKKTRTTVKCLICREIFPNYRECNAHAIKKHGQEFKCSKCDKRFKARRYLLNHVKRHDLQQLKHVCDICGKRFLHPSDLTEHTTVHSDEYKFPCKWLGCDRKFKFKKDLNKHFIRAHTATAQFQCEHCVQQFDDKRLYTQHLRTHAEPTIPCHRCGKLFRHYSTRNKHMRYCDHVIVE